VTNLFTVLLAAALSTNPPAAVSNLVRQAAGAEAAAADPADPVEAGYRRLLAADDAAAAEVDGWIREAAGAAAPDAGLQEKIRARLYEVEAAYRSFLRAHPEHVPARIALGSHLNDQGREEEAAEAWEAALKHETNSPALYNNLAAIYSHRGPIEKAFDFLERALELNPREPVYYHNYANLVFLFRRDAMKRWDFTEQQVFDKALDLFERALRLDPESFLLAADIAQTHYGVRPFRPAAALAAWERALALADDDLERQGVLLHLARVHMMAHRPDEAAAALAQVNHPVHDTMKQRLERRLQRLREAGKDPGKDA
jgi:tetratricopeptide (TPR) repeat protein